jgi:hypothetical protein
MTCLILLIPLLIFLRLSLRRATRSSWMHSSFSTSILWLMMLRPSCLRRLAHSTPIHLSASVCYGVCFVDSYAADLDDISLRNNRFALFDGYQETISGDMVDVPSGLNTILAPDVAISLIRYGTDAFFFDAFNDGQMGGSILSLSIEGLSSGRRFSPPITVAFAITAPTTANTTFTCTYYSFEVQGWATGGCTLDEAQSTSTLVVCSCVHLTNFAVLLDHQGLADAALSRSDRLALQYITQVGLPISIFLMALTVIFYLWHRVCCLVDPCVSL